MMLPHGKNENNKPIVKLSDILIECIQGINDSEQLDRLINGFNMLMKSENPKEELKC